MDALTGEVKLRVENLSKIMDKKTIISDINFEVYEGEFLSILGPSGCGKTTILRIIAGLLSPTTGAIIKNGTDITLLPPSKRSIGVVFQNYALFENMTVLGNVEYAMKLNKSLKASSRRRALELIEQVGLTEHINKKPYSLSGGQQQRVAIARTLALSPDVVLFDEPMSALDVEMRHALRGEIKQLQREHNMTIIYITHDQEEAFAMSDRIIVMKESRINQIGTPDEIINSPADDYVRSFVYDNLRIKIDSLSKYLR